MSGTRLVKMAGLVLLLVVFNTPLLNAAGSAWLPPVNLSNWQTVVNSDHQWVDAGADGTVLACWTTYSFGTGEEMLWARVRSPAGDWSAAFNPSGSLPHYTLSKTTVGCRVAPDGTAFVQWRRRQASPGTPQEVRGAVRTPGGDWQPYNLTYGQTFDEVRSVDLAIGPNGHRAAVWVGCNTSPLFGTCSTYARLGPPMSIQWTPVSNLNPDPIMPPNRKGDIAYALVESNGSVVVVWDRYYDPGNRELVARAGEAAGAVWDPGVSVLDTQLNPAVADWLARPVMDPGGTVVVAYNSRLPIMAQNAAHYSVTRHAGGNWSAPAAISHVHPQGALRTPRLGAGQNGTVIAAWDREITGTESVLEANARDPGGVWGSPQTLTGPQVSVRGFDLGVWPDGRAMILWSMEDKSVATLRSNTCYSLRLPHSNWGSGGQGALDDWYSEAHGATLVLASDGSAAALWAGSDTAQPVNQQDRVRAAVFPHGGVGWGAPETLAQGLLQSAVWEEGMAAAPAGRPIVALWYQMRDVATGGRTAIFFGEMPLRKLYLPLVVR